MDAVQTLRAVVDELARMVDGDVPGAAAAELVVAVQGEVSRLTAITARLLPTVEAEVGWAADGHRSVTAWLAAATGLPWPRARSLVELGRSSRSLLAASAQAAVDGTVPVDRVETMTRLATNTPARQAALAAPGDECGERFLLDQARALSADCFSRLVRRWAAAADPDADERGYRAAIEREHLTLSSTTHGVHLSGFLTTEHAATLDAALRTVIGPPALGDPRTTAQRRGQGLADLARLVLDHGLVGTGAAVRPHLTCVVDWATLNRSLRPTSSPAGRPDRGLGPPPGDPERFGVGELLDAGPVPRWVLAKLACDSEISRVVFGPDGQVIDAGRSERTFSGPRRRAVIARDRHCRFPGCSAPPALCEVHHVGHWAARGSTDVANGLLLCWHHHDHVHRHDMTITVRPGAPPQFTDRHGRQARRAA